MTVDIVERIGEEAARAGGATTTAHGMAVVTVPPETLLAVVRRLKAELAFDLLLDVTAVDWPQRTPRFDVVYHFYSTTHHLRVRVKTVVADAEPAVDSLVSLYGSAAFAERECHDMYGIEFRGNPDLRPILLYEGFVGHPLRKDYPKLAEQPLVPYRTERA
ncbi:MAG TPA: NADH-quinone oxidoreductase subunit C [Casimicrobiaceae bacterium]|nr:NADH-quinone oxidoreductase subunit C [Casimicrobiaceae bacterium]